MHKKNQNIAIAAGILLSFSLSACAGSNTGQSQTSQTVTATSEETQETTAEEERRRLRPALSARLQALRHWTRPIRYPFRQVR